MVYFSVATLTHVLLLGLAAVSGGGFVWAALAYITVFTAALDRFVPFVLPQMPEGAEFPTGARLSVLLGALHFPLLLLAVFACAFMSHSPLEKVGIFIAFALFFGQVSHPNAHELIHRKERYARQLGRWVYASLLMGHHASAHVLIHHTHVGSDADPNSAPRGMGFYRFFIKAWRRSFTEGLKIETRRLIQAGKPSGAHPYRRDAIVGAGFLALSFLMGQWLGLAVYLGLALYAQVQILLADYVQHYGLRRAQLESGKLAPVSEAHSWNAPHWFSSSLTLNAPRHSDHHMNPQRPYPALRLKQDVMPTLPHALPVMAVIALYPPLYRKVMARALARLQEVQESA